MFWPQYSFLDLISLAKHNTVAALVTMNFGYVTLNHTLITENEDNEKKSLCSFQIYSWAIDPGHCFPDHIPKDVSQAFSNPAISFVNKSA